MIKQWWYIVRDNNIILNSKEVAAYKEILQLVDALTEHIRKENEEKALEVISQLEEFFAISNDEIKAIKKGEKYYLFNDDVKLHKSDGIRAEVMNDLYSIAYNSSPYLRQDTPLFNKRAAQVAGNTVYDKIRDKMEDFMVVISSRCRSREVGGDIRRATMNEFIYESHLVTTENEDPLKSSQHTELEPFSKAVTRELTGELLSPTFKVFSDFETELENSSGVELINEVIQKMNDAQEEYDTPEVFLKYCKEYSSVQKSVIFDEIVTRAQEVSKEGLTNENYEDAKYYAEILETMYKAEPLSAVEKAYEAGEIIMNVKNFERDNNMNATPSVTINSLDSADNIIKEVIDDMEKSGIENSSAKDFVQALLKDKYNDEHRKVVIDDFIDKAMQVSKEGFSLENYEDAKYYRDLLHEIKHSGFKLESETIFEIDGYFRDFDSGTKDIGDKAQILEDIIQTMIARRKDYNDINAFAEIATEFGVLKSLNAIEQKMETILKEEITKDTYLDLDFYAKAIRSMIVNSEEISAEKAFELGEVYNECFQAMQKFNMNKEKEVESFAGKISQENLLEDKGMSF